MDVRAAVPGPRRVSVALALGLHVQHGGERRGGSRFKHHVEYFQYYAVPEAEENVGGLAGSDCRVDHTSHELGVAGLSTLGWYGGRTQFVASRHCGPYHMVVQVSVQTRHS